jgi:SanA protein
MIYYLPVKNNDGEVLMKRKKILIISLGAAAALCLLGALIVSGVYLLVDSYGKYIHPVEKLPECKAALVLGCSPTVRNGRFINSLFVARMNKAAELYLSGKVKVLILSGDNGRVTYNEPQEMRRALLKRGIPDSAIFCDYAGFRTLDSVIRADAIFGQRKIIVVSQTFHCARAIYLGRNLGVECYGLAADVRIPRRWLIRNTIRETLARCAAVADIIIGRHPKFYGKRIDLDKPQVKDPVSTFENGII